MEYRGFLSDDRLYDALLAEWERRWERLGAEAPSPEHWRRPWVFEGDRDGNPLFSVWWPEGRLGLRVIQHEPSEAGPPFRAWEDVFAPQQPEQVHELVIACQPTDGHFRQAEDAIRRWLRRGRGVGSAGVG